MGQAGPSKRQVGPAGDAKKDVSGNTGNTPPNCLPQSAQNGKAVGAQRISVRFLAMPRDYLAGLIGSAFVATKRNTRSVMYHSMAAMTDQSASIDFNVFGEPLVKLLIALGNK